MERIDKTVFLSYRRTNLPWALAIFQDLTQHGYDVFFDYSGVATADLHRVVLENVKARAHFLVLLTPTALARSSEPTDWLRLEIETAIATQRNIVPLVLEGFEFGAPQIEAQLGGSLAKLKQYNALRILPEYFEDAMERLRRRFLEVPSTAVLHPVPSSAKQKATEQKVAATSAPPVRFNSCFISFSTKDIEFAQTLYVDLRRHGVECWFSEHDMRSGEKVHEQIDRAILLMDKLLLILSEHSIRSPWVQTEIAKARKRESSERRRILFPIRLIDYEQLRNWECFDADSGTDSAREIREYFILDFSGWAAPTSYQSALDRLLRDLRQTS